MVKRLRGGKLQMRRSTEVEALELPRYRQAQRHLKLEYIDPRILNPDTDNARLHPDKQLAMLGASIRRFEFNDPILASLSSKKVIAGHGRLKAALQAQLTEVPVIWIAHLSPEEERAYALAANRLAEHSKWDPELLLRNLDHFAIPSESLCLELTGFDTADYDHLRDLASPAVKPNDTCDHIPPLTTRAVTRTNDLWKLGGHFLLCADATEPASYQTLLGSTAAQMVITDPPYNVPIRGHVTSRSRHREFAMAAGEMTSREFVAFLQQGLTLMHRASCDGAIHFVFMDWRHVLEVMAAARAVYQEFKQLCVWSKEQAGMGSFYRSRHELVFVFNVGTAPHINNFGLGERGRYRTNVWQYASPRPGNRSDGEAAIEHPTVKPCAMLVDAIKDCSKVDGIVLDPFGGSGSTLIAAERTQRRARLVEIDPLYVDLTIRRWQQLSGAKAILEATGERFEAVAMGRNGGEQTDER